MARLRLNPNRFFDIPYNVFDIVLQMRGAIDPDSGQIVCHFYSIGVAALETDKGPVPLVVAEGCLMLTFGPENVEAVLSSGSAVEVETLTVRNGKLIVGDVEIDHYWGLAALAYARELAGETRLYKLRLEVDGEEALIAGIRVDLSDAGPVLMLVPRSCEYIEEQEELPTHM